MDVNNTFGAWFIGAEVSLVAFGFSILQCWIFFQQWHSEHYMLKIVVVLTLFLGFFLIVLTSHALYHYLITSIGNPAALQEIIWSFSAEPWVSEATVSLTHLFYTFRIFFINRSYFLFAVLLVLTIAHTVLDLLAAGLELSDTSGITAPKLTAQLAQAGLSLDLAIDIIIMISMFHFFYTSRTHIKSTQNLLNKLALYTFASGSLTVVANVVILATLITLPTTQIYSGASFVLPHLYSNCLLALLNSRKHLQARYNTKTATSNKPSVTIDGVSPSLPMFTVSRSAGDSTTANDQFGTAGSNSEIYPVGHVKDESRETETYGAESPDEFNMSSVAI